MQVRLCIRCWGATLAEADLLVCHLTRLHIVLLDVVSTASLYAMESMPNEGSICIWCRGGTCSSC